LRTWRAPVAAAAVIIALAAALVIVRNIPNGGSVPPVTPANCTLPHASGATPAGAASPSGRDVPGTWAEGDQAIMFWTVVDGGAAVLRRLDIHPLRRDQRPAHRD